MTRGIHGRWVRFAAIAALSMMLAPAAGRADVPAPYPGTKTIETSKPYGALVQSLAAAIKANKMDFAIRMLKASVPAGIEAPIRFYITENPATGNASLTYRTPSSVFNPYRNAELDAMAAELDVIFAKIASDAVK